MQNSVCIKHTIGNTQSTLLSVGFFICHLYITKENNLADIFSPCTVCNMVKDRNLVLYKFSTFVAAVTDTCW